MGVFDMMNEVCVGNLFKLVGEFVKLMLYVWYGGVIVEYKDVVLVGKV